MLIKLKESEECTLEFTHVNGQPAKLYVAMNPLTGDWLEDWKVGTNTQSDLDNKNGAVKLINGVIKKSAEKNLPCKVTIQKRKILPDARRIG